MAGTSLCTRHWAFHRVMSSPNFTDYSQTKTTSNSWYAGDTRLEPLSSDAEPSLHCFPGSLWVTVTVFLISCLLQPLMDLLALHPEGHLQGLKYAPDIILLVDIRRQMTRDWEVKAAAPAPSACTGEEDSSMQGWSSISAQHWGHVRDGRRQLGSTLGGPMCSMSRCRLKGRRSLWWIQSGAQGNRKVTQTCQHQIQQVPQLPNCSGQKRTTLF